MASGFRYLTGVTYASVISLALLAGVARAEAQSPNDGHGYLLNRATAVSRKYCGPIAPGTSTGDVAARCAQRLRGLNKAYVMFYAVHAYSVADDGPDFTRDLARADRFRAEQLITVALKIPQLTGVLRRAFLDARDDLLNEDALED
jgi:hypothetical protein